MRKDKLKELIAACNPENDEDKFRLDLLSEFMATKAIAELSDDKDIQGAAFINFLRERLGSIEKVKGIFPHKYLASNNATAKLFSQMQLTTIEMLPTEMQKMLFDNLELTRKAPLARTTPDLYKVFKNKQPAEKLLYYVKNASYAKVEKIIRKHPRLMFEKVTYALPNGKRETITPIQEAAKVYDEYMLKLFEQVLKEKYPEKMDTFNSQIQEQADHVDMEPLFQAYDNYLAQYQRYERKEIRKLELETAWKKLGEAQLEYLPGHMLREYFRKNGWSERSKFDNPKPPTRCKVRDQWTCVSLTLLPLRKIEVTMVRGNDSEYGGAPWASKMLFPLDNGNLSHLKLKIEQDPKIFRKLLDVRKEQLVQRKLRSESSAKEPPKLS